MLVYDADRAVEIIQTLQAQPPSLSDPGNPSSVSRGTLADMLLAGFTQADPFVMAECRAHVRRLLVSLRSGQVPVEESGYAMGTADPTGLLPEGQVVYLRDGLAHSGDVLVYKSPGLHPGDVRKLRAVTLDGVVRETVVSGVSRKRATLLIFSVRGARAEADKIANSDLDGDEYLVRWAFLTTAALRLPRLSARSLAKYLFTSALSSDLPLQIISDKEIVESFTPSAPWEPKPAEPSAAVPPAAAVAPVLSPAKATLQQLNGGAGGASAEAQADLFVRQRRASHRIGEISNTWDVRSTSHQPP